MAGGNGDVSGVGEGSEVIGIVAVGNPGAGFIEISSILAALLTPTPSTTSFETALT